MMNDTWTVERVVEVIRSLALEEDLPAHLSTSAIAGTDTVETLGIDSLGGAYLIERLEETIGIQMPDDFLAPEDDVAKIAKRLNDLVEAGG